MKKCFGVLLVLLMSFGVFVCAEVDAGSDVSFEEGIGDRDITATWQNDNWEIVGLGDGGKVDEDAALSEDGKEALALTKDVSNASVGFLKDSGKEVWAGLKEGIANPVNASKDLYKKAGNALGRLAGVSDEEGEKIWLSHYFFGMGMGYSLFWIIIILVVSGFLTRNSLRNKWEKFGTYSLLGFGAATLIFSAINRTPFWEDFAFLMIVLVMVFFMKGFWVFYGKDFKYQLTFGVSYLGYALKQSLFSGTIIIFIIIYFLFNSIPLLNVGMHILTLEFLGYNNWFFTWIIRPLIVALLLVFGGDIFNLYSKSKRAEEKFNKELRKKAIEEKNINELHA